MDGWETILSFCGPRPIFRAYVSFREGILQSLFQTSVISAQLDINFFVLWRWRWLSSKVQALIWDSFSLSLQSNKVAFPVFVEQLWIDSRCKSQIQLLIFCIFLMICKIFVAKNTWLLWDLHIKYISFCGQKHLAALGCFSPCKKLTNFPPSLEVCYCRRSGRQGCRRPWTAEDRAALVSSAVGAGRSVFFFVCWLMSPERKCDKCSRLKKMVDDLKVVCKTFVSFVDFMRFQMISWVRVGEIPKMKYSKFSTGSRIVGSLLKWS